MPQVTYEFKATGVTEVLDAIRSVKRVGMTYLHVQSKAFVDAMAGVGPTSEWAWLDYLSAGDVARVVRLERIALENDTADDVRAAARQAISELRRVAEERMAGTSSPPVTS